MSVKVVHRVSSGRYDEVHPTLDALGIKYRKLPMPGGYYFVSFDVDEADSRWPEVANLIREKLAADVFDTRFTKEEVSQAEWVRLIPRSKQGYPQPEEDMAWSRITYESECSHCGVGYRQQAPFYLASEPRLGKHDFVSLFWTYSIFCTPKVVETLQAHGLQGCEVWKAIIHDTGQPSQVISQLVFPTVAGPGLVKDDKQEPEKCWRCGITKYAFHLRGYMHLERKALRPDVDFQLTHEWFGSGTRSGYREILVSNRVARLILEQGWRGVVLKPVEVV